MHLNSELESSQGKGAYVGHVAVCEYKEQQMRNKGASNLFLAKLIARRGESGVFSVFFSFLPQRRKFN